jgi:uncharacterized membrane protein YfcA
MVITSELLLGPVFGLVVGLALGLTGGGGSILAVPLLVYGLAVAPSEAVGLSLAAVGSTALVGALQRCRYGEVDGRTGLSFAAAGMLGAPAGTWINAYLPDALLLGLFGGLVLFVAVRMWRRVSQTPGSLRPRRTRPTWRWHDTGILLAAGFATGVLSGLFGVGGGFVIVPALVLIRGMPIHRAVATSLLVIALVSAAGVTSYLVAGRPLALPLASLFVIGGAGGVALGTLLGRRLSGPNLQKGFAVALIAVAVFMITRSIV